jgi:hypothetical protein
MNRSTRRWRAVGAIGLLGAASVAALTSSVSPAAGEGPIQQLEEVGLLRLDLTGSAGKFTFTPAGAAAPTDTQSISVNGKCAASASGTPMLASLTSVGGTLGLVTHGLGVRQKNTCGPAEGRFSGDEMVTVALGSFFGSDVLVADAELDVEGKFNASVDVSLDGADAINRSLVSSSSDNGPDSGVGDNDRVLLSDEQSDVEPFRTMTLSAPTGEVSLEGGGDGSYAQYSAAGKVGDIGQSLGTADTIFRLVRRHEFAGHLFCEESRTDTVIGGSATSAEVTRLANDGGQECEDVGVTLEIRDEGVFLDKGTTGLETGEPQAVNALVDIVWAPQAATVPLPPRQINLDPGNPNSQFQPVQWCLSWDPVTETAVHPANVPWCLVEEEVELQGDGTVVQAQRYHGDGDPLWK